MRDLAKNWVKVTPKAAPASRGMFEVHDISEFESVCNGCSFQRLREKHGDKLKVSRHGPRIDDGTDCHVEGKLVGWFMSIDHCCGLTWYEALNKTNRDPIFEPEHPVEKSLRLLRESLEEGDFEPD